MSTAATIIHRHTASFFWAIDGLSWLTVHGCFECKFGLAGVPFVLKLVYKDYIDYALFYLCTENRDPVYLSFSVSLLVGDRVLCSIEQRPMALRPDAPWSRNSMRLETLLDEAKAHADLITVRLVATVATAPPTLSSASPALPPVDPTGGDLLQLLQSGAHADVNLAVDGVEFPSHRAILAARSPVFKAMFSSGMSESKSKEVAIEDADPAVFRELLRSGACASASIRFTPLPCCLQLRVHWAV